MTLCPTCLLPPLPVPLIQVGSQQPSAAPPAPRQRLLYMGGHTRVASVPNWLGPHPGALSSPSVPNLSFGARLKQSQPPLAPVPFLCHGSNPPVPPTRAVPGAGIMNASTHDSYPHSCKSQLKSEQCPGLLIEDCNPSLHLSPPPVPLFLS